MKGTVPESEISSPLIALKSQPSPNEFAEEKLESRMSSEYNPTTPVNQQKIIEVSSSGSSMN